jgi:hypothetical protein
MTAVSLLSSTIHDLRENKRHFWNYLRQVQENGQDDHYRRYCIEAMLSYKRRMVNCFEAAKTIRSYSR